MCSEKERGINDTPIKIYFFRSPILMDENLRDRERRNDSGLKSPLVSHMFLKSTQKECLNYIKIAQ